MQLGVDAVPVDLPLRALDEAVERDRYGGDDLSHGYSASDPGERKMQKG